MPDLPRLQSGIPGLDELLGGGLIPGTLTVVLGATGIGKTQLGLQFARHGQEQEGQRGVVMDMTSRGDSQYHRKYAARLFGWELREMPVEERKDLSAIWERDRARVDYIHLFRRSGRRVTISDLEPEDWREWKIELARKLEQAVAFLYGNFAHGVRRLIIDGVEPTDRASESFQLRMFEYVYHQILRKQDDWVARDLFRAQFRLNADAVEQHRYNYGDIGCLLLCTAHEMMLDDLLRRPVESGDMLSNANTILLMGKMHAEGRTGRALCVAKHRGSACDESIVGFEITDFGIQLRP